MKASEKKHSKNNQYSKGMDRVQSFGPKPVQNRNKSLLQKYSFEDNDLSRTSQLISELNQDQDDEDWLRLEIKEITSIGKELITFYLAVKYLVEYQVGNVPNFDKKKTNVQKSENIKQAKQVKSKLVHGSILQTEQKNLILNLKCKKQQLMPAGTKPILSRLEFQIMRIFQNKSQPVLIAKQIINNPDDNSEYEIAFQQHNSPSGSKPKSVVAMIFQINGAIGEEIEGNENSDSEFNSKADEVSEHLEGDDDHQKFQNYTLGKSDSVKPFSKKQSQANIFDSNHSEEDEDQNVDAQKLQDGLAETPNQDNSYFSNQKPSNAELIYKLNELSNMMDENLQKSKNQGQAYNNYLEATSNMIEQFQSDSGGNLQNNGNEKNLNIKKTNTIKKVQNEKTNPSTINQNLSQPNNPNTNQNQTKTFNSNPNDTQTDDRYNYISRINNTNMTGQKFNYESRVDNSNSAKTEGQKFNFLSRVEDNNTFGDKYTAVSKGDDSNIVGERYNYQSSSKIDQTHIAEKDDYELRIQNQNFWNQSHLNDLSSIGPSQSNSPLIQNKSTLPKKEPLFQFNAKRQKSPTNAFLKSQQNQPSSRVVPFNFADLDSSNIRYQYNDNDVSNIEETKNMQELIAQIQKIQKQWYEKRVLNRKNRQQKEKRNENQDDDNKAKQFDFSSNPDDVLDLELKNFKIKFSQQTFYRKLIDGLKNKHLTYTKRNEANQNGDSQIPKNYLVFLAANEVDDQNMDYEQENNSKIQIRIPSQQIDRLLELQSLEKEKSLSNSGSNGLSPTMSKNQEKQIIKAFEKQLFSKVMKIKVLKNDKNGAVQKKKARIIEIALEDESLTLSQMQFQGFARGPQQNRISLVGMYPLPIFGEDNKDGETSFYQNISIQPLQIELYDVKTGAQEGQLKFQLVKAKVDREIQTLEPLQDIEQTFQQGLYAENQKAHQENSSLLVGYEVHQDRPKVQGISEQIKSHKNSSIQNKSKQKTLEIDIDQPFRKENLSSSNSRLKNLSRAKNVISQLSNPFSLQSEQLEPKKTWNLEQNPKRSHSNIAQPLDRKNHHQLAPTNDCFQNLHRVKKQRRDNQVRSPKNEKDIESIGKIVKNPSNSLIEMHPIVFEKENEANVKTVLKQKIPSSEDKKVEKTSPIKVYNASSRLHNITPVFPNSPSSINENHDLQSDSSYILMKQQFLATANMLQSIKMKAQFFIDKVESERKICTSDDLQSEKEGWKGFESRGESNVALTVPIQKKANCLGVNSFVVNQTVLSRRQVSHDQANYTRPIFIPQMISANPKAAKNAVSKRSSTNKSRNSNNDTSPIEPRRNKFSVPHERSPQFIPSRNKNYQRQEQSNGSAFSNGQKKQKRKQKHKKPLLYKEESDYQFTEEQDRGHNYGRQIKEREQNVSPKKILDKGEFSEASNELDSSGTNEGPIPSLQYPKGSLPIRSGKKNIKESAISNYLSEQIMEIKIFSLKIKLLSLPLAAKHLRNSSEGATKGKEFFVLVYTDFSEENKGTDDNLSFMSPVTQKCLKKNPSKENELIVLFNEKTQNYPQRKTSEGYLLLKGVEKTKFFVEIYQSQPPSNSQKPRTSKDVTSLQHISMITLSPQHKKSKVKPFASLSVTFIQLLAQQESEVSTSRMEKSDFITYTNFLYENQKIHGKININYITQLQNSDRHQNDSHFSASRSKPKLSGMRKEAIEKFKPLKNQYFKKYPDTKKNSQAQKDNDFKNLRSESGMTKKLTPRRKIYAKKGEQQQQRTSIDANTIQNQADPLEILKRKLPRPFKSQEKGNKHSLSYAIRLNRPYLLSPMSVGKEKQQYKSLNSSSSSKLQDNQIKQGRQKKSVYSSSHFEGDGFVQSPKKAKNNMQLMQLRQKKQQKKLNKLKEYQAASRNPIPYQQTEDTRISQNKRYEGGNIRFGKSSRFESGDSQQLSRKGSKSEMPGPGHYEVKSIFDRHMIKEP